MGTSEAKPQAEERWLVHSVYHQKGLDAALWWGPERRGYTTHIERAGRYTREEAARIVDGSYEKRSVAYREADVLARVHTVLDVSVLEDLTPLSGAGKGADGG